MPASPRRAKRKRPPGRRRGGLLDPAQDGTAPDAGELGGERVGAGRRGDRLDGRAGSAPAGAGRPSASAAVSPSPGLQPARASATMKRCGDDGYWTPPLASSFVPMSSSSDMPWSPIPMPMSPSMPPRVTTPQA